MGCRGVYLIANLETAGRGSREPAPKIVERDFRAMIGAGAWIET